MRDYTFLNIKVFWFNAYPIALIIWAIFLVGKLATKILVLIKIENK